jgi:Icc-related predicted phosphoesterase
MKRKRFNETSETKQQKMQFPSDAVQQLPREIITHIAQYLASHMLYNMVLGNKDLYDKLNVEMMKRKIVYLENRTVYVVEGVQTSSGYGSNVYGAFTDFNVAQSLAHTLENGGYARGYELSVHAAPLNKFFATSDDIEVRDVMEAMGWTNENLYDESKKTKKKKAALL